MYELLLKHIAMHISLSPDEEQHFLKAVTFRKLRKKQFLLQEGDISKGTAFVTKGLLKIYSMDRNGVEHIIQFAPPGWWAGDMKSLKNQQPATLFIDAIEDTEILWMRKEDLDQLYAGIPVLERFFRVLAENSVINYQERLIGTLSLPAVERYQAFCSKYPALIEQLPQKYVASYIGVTPEFLSKMRKGKMA